MQKDTLETYAKLRQIKVHLKLRAASLTEWPYTMTFRSLTKNYYCRIDNFRTWVYGFPETQEKIGCNQHWWHFWSGSSRDKKSLFAGGAEVIIGRQSRSVNTGIGNSQNSF